ncbi:hypothetical protein KY289_001142 [Solanum tuberosum]|nr:hypothetical protein KY289_001142 [Solanum tuberosum]
MEVMEKEAPNWGISNKNSPVATTLWKTFAAAAGLRGPFPHQKDTMFKWWNDTCCVKLGPLFNAVPTFIMWQIWKRRNMIRHGGKISVQDEASKGNPRPSASAFCIRNDAGEFIFAEAKNLESATSLEAEVVALRSGLEFCILNNLLPVILETDSFTIK